MSKLLVTGGYGFIGSNFVKYWLGTYPEDTIVILDKLTYAGHLDNLSGLSVDEQKRVVSLQGDICNESHVRQAMKDVNVVVHFAAESHVDRSNMDPEIFWRTNIEGTEKLLKAVLESGVKLFHHISTDEVFGELPLEGTSKFDETTAHNPTSPYAKSKSAAEGLVRRFGEEHGLPFTITNCTNNYGPYQDPEKLISRFTTSLIRGEKVPLMGDGRNVRDWIHVWDHCRAIDMVIHAALSDGKYIGETYCVGGESEVSNKAVTYQILEILGLDESYIQPVPDRLNHDGRYAVDNSKIRRELGWSPSIKFEDGLRSTIDWYKNNEKWWKSLKEGRPNIDPEAQITKRLKEGK